MNINFETLARVEREQRQAREEAVPRARAQAQVQSEMSGEGEVNFEALVQDAHEQRQAREEAALIARARPQAGLEQEAHGRDELTRKSQETWSVIGHVLAELKRKDIPADADILGVNGLRQYRDMRARHHINKGMIGAIHRTREDRLARERRIEGWSLHTELKDGQKTVPLFLGEDGYLYGVKSMSLHERDRGIQIPSTILGSGDPFPDLQACNQTLESLAYLTAEHGLALPASEQG